MCSMVSFADTHVPLSLLSTCPVGNECVFMTKTGNKSGARTSPHVLLTLLHSIARIEVRNMHICLGGIDSAEMGYASESYTYETATKPRLR